MLLEREVFNDQCVHMCIDLEIIKDINRGVVNELFILTQPAHLQKIKGRKLTPRERDLTRAELLRSKITKMEKG